MPVLPAGRETYINNNVNDITYMSELIPSHHRIYLSVTRDEGYPSRLYRVIGCRSGLIRTNNLLALCVRKLCTH